MTTRIGIIGAGDLGRTVAALLQDDEEFAIAGFYDDKEASRGVKAVDGLPLLGPISEVALAVAFDEALIAIGYRHLEFRLALFERLRTAAVPFATFIHPSAFVHRTARIAAGAILFPRCVVDAGASVGATSLLNTGCVIAHDSHIGPGNFLGPGVLMAGLVRTGSRCFIGAGTVVKDNVCLEDDCSTGAGAVVVGNVAARTLVAGVPARAMKRWSSAV
ncbi:MAG: acetyltransferase [Alphaproteobacteria bacterium]|nr:acetyltransferase [Alphaproteobacteria bacterium]